MKLIASLLIAAALVAPALSHAAEPAAPAAKADLAKGEATYNTICAACHGAEGNSGVPAYPKLAQQHPDYLVKQLQEFKSGKRANPIMMGMAAGLSDADMKNVAAWLGTKTSAANFAKEKDLVVLGERIYRGGVADRQIAACAGCHNPTGAGIPAQYPRLAGQHADYTMAQLTALREHGNRGAGQPSVGRGNSAQMSGVAAKLNDREIKAVADYVAGLR
jgi:cytochrome c553